jgi:hypothetical protein
MVIGGIVALVGVLSLQTSAVAADETLLVGENDPEEWDGSWTPTELPAKLGVRDDSQIVGLEELRDMHATGAITDEEYQLAKSRLLAGES